MLPVALKLTRAFKPARFAGLGLRFMCKYMRAGEGLFGEKRRGGAALYWCWVCPDIIYCFTCLILFTCFNEEKDNIGLAECRQKRMHACMSKVIHSTIPLTTLLLQIHIFANTHTALPAHEVVGMPALSPTMETVSDKRIYHTLLKFY